jgi:UV DNA damage endonuclease
MEHIELGLCCINSGLRVKKIFVNRTCRLQTALDKGLAYIKELAIQNLKDCVKLIEWNEKHGITAYRLSSDMFPHFSNPEYPDHNYSLDFAKPYLYEIGAKAFEYGHRLSMHPGQYNQIGALKEEVFGKTLLDLSCHCKILDIIEEDLDFQDNTAIICIHGGGVYGNKEKTIQRWCTNFYRLPENIRRRIAIENCEKCYNIDDCLRISQELNIPVIFDCHHYGCYNILHEDEKVSKAEEVLSRVFQTWKKRNLKPYCHISEQGKGRIGHHSDYISKIPDYYLNIKIPFTLDVEAKCKEKAIFKIKELYKSN